MGTVEKQFPSAIADKPPEKNWSAACRSYGIIWGQLGRAIVDQLGEKGVEAIKEGQRRVARLQVPRAFESGRFERNAKGMAEYLLLAEQTLGMVVEIAPGATQKKASFRWLKCPLYDDPSEESTPELCDAYVEFEMEAVKLCNPKLTCTSAKCMGRGDDFCEVTFELED
ncbi:MAG: L-2-amino-thiazoline-4-carboxylic acid hydrolase [Candidatus Eiseniibacteriota bacterium]|nr:MAG: L-2-amino-thiazoline-4-carboxylic acid hydrolase [Candidatus Eisenbacteria bacterium]